MRLGESLQQHPDTQEPREPEEGVDCEEPSGQDLWEVGNIQNGGWWNEWSSPVPVTSKRHCEVGKA